MRMHRRSFYSRPTCEELEGRALLSGLHLPGSVPFIHSSAIKTDPAAVAAIIAALRGGPGNEFVSVVTHQIKNPLALIRKFETGAVTQATINGVTVRNATILSTFAGSHYDYQAVVAAGALVLRNHSFELGAILRGPNRSPGTAYYVFGINTGAGAAVGPYFSARPGITPDTLVTLSAGANGTNPAGMITNLRNGAVTPINPSAILFNGSTVRVFLDKTQLPSSGFTSTHYRFSFWTQSQPGHDFGTVGSLAPDSTMTPFGVVSR
jgi:hypothetical protein